MERKIEELTEQLVDRNQDLEVMAKQIKKANTQSVFAGTKESLIIKWTSRSDQVFWLDLIFCGFRSIWYD